MLTITQLVTLSDTCGETHTYFLGARKETAKKNIHGITDPLGGVGPIKGGTAADAGKEL
jgi:hypothetical protein